MPVSYTWPVNAKTPTLPFTVNEEPFVLTAQFGDGYAQHAAPHLNSNRRTFSLQWDNLTNGEKETIRVFLRARNAVDPFYWTPPTEAVQIAVRCPRWSITRNQGTFYNMQAEFVEHFEP